MLCTVINQQGADTIQIDLHLVRIAPVGRRRWNEFLAWGYDTSLPWYAYSEGEG